MVAGSSQRSILSDLSASEGHPQKGGPRPGMMEAPLKASLQPWPQVDRTEGQMEASCTP